MVHLYTPVVSEHNIETGDITREYTTRIIYKAPVLTANVARKFIYDSAYTKAGGYTLGAFFDQSQRMIIIDSKDLSGYNPTLNDHFEFKNQRWEIIKYSEAELEKAYIFIVKYQPNMQPVGRVIDNTDALVLVTENSYEVISNE